MGLLKKISVKFQSQFSPSQASSSASLPVTSHSTGRKVVAVSSSSPVSTSSDLITGNNSHSSSSSSDAIITPSNNYNSWPTLTSSSHTSPSSHQQVSASNVNGFTFVPGDRVKVIKNVDQLRIMQEGHGGWNVKMIKLPFTVGTVHRITISGNVRVRFGDEITSPKFTINPNALAPVPENYSIGDTIRVDDDIKRVKCLQKNHGEWIDQMECIIGKIGNIIALDEDNDLQVLFDCQRVYTLNPINVSLSSSSSSSTAEAGETSVASIYPSLKSLSSQLQMKPHVDEYAWFNSNSTGHNILSTHGTSVTERLKLLEDKFSEIEEVYSCNICMERVRKVVFMCGHGTCIKCSHSLTSCHMCRLPITRKIHLY